MDPLTITCTVGAIARTVFNISQTLHKFIKDTKGVNSSVKDLAVEVSGLSTALKAVQAGLADPAIQRAERKAEKTESIELWRSVHGSLMNTRATVDRLDEALEDIRDDRSNFAKQAIRQLRLNLKQEEITGLRAQFRTHIGALQMTLLMMNVRATCMTSEVSAELGPKIETLGGMITELKTSIETSRTRSDYLHVPQLIATKHSERLTKSAEKILSSASSMYSQSEWGGSVLGGSVYGEVLDDLQRQRMHEWIPPAPLIEETASDMASNDALSPNGDSIFTDADKRTTTQTDDTELFSPAVDDDDTGGEFEFEVVERFLQGGLKAFEVKDYSEAVELIESGHALTENLTFQQKQQLDLRGSQLILAQCSYHCDDLDSAEAHLITYAEQYPPTPEDSVAIQACHASHLLAQVCLRKNKADVARGHCKKALIGRRRILGKDDDAYFESLFLLAEICEVSGAGKEAKVYRDMIPSRLQGAFTKAGVQEGTATPKLVTPEAPGGKLALPSLVTTSPPADKTTMASAAAKQALRASVVFDFDSLEPQPEYVSEVMSPSAALQIPDLERKFSSNNPFRRKSADDRDALQRARTNVDTGSRTQSRRQSPARGSPSRGVQRVKSTGAIPQAVATAEARQPLLALTDEPEKVDWSLLWRFATRLDSSRIPPGIDKGPSNYLTSAALKKSPVETLRQLAVNLSQSPTAVISPLHLAVSINHEQLVRLFVEEHGYDVNKTCPHHRNEEPSMGPGNTAMHCAAQYGRVELIRLLFEFGADVTSKNDSQYTPLHVAVAFGKIEVVTELFDASSSTFISGEETPLHVAARYNRTGIMLALLGGTNNLEVFDSDGRTPLHVAADRNSFGCVEELLQRGADVESTCGADVLTPLHLAARKGHAKAVQELLSFRAQVEARTARGETALHLSIRNRQPQVFRTLLGHGADVDAQDNQGVTSLRKAIDDRQRVIVDLLIQRKASLEIAEHRTGRRAMHAAVLTGSVDLVRALMEAGAKTTAADSNGRSPYDLAASMNYTELEALLSPTRRTVDLDEQPGLEVAEVQPGLELAGPGMSTAAYGGSSSSGVHYDSGLIPVVVEPNPPGWTITSEWTPLQRAAYLGHKDEVLALTSKGASLSKRTRDGFTARDLAGIQGHVAIEALLEGLEMRPAPITKRLSRLFVKTSK